MNKNFIKTISLISLIILNSCGLGSSIKSAVTGQTKPVGDEFLVEKKNPLTVPPDIDELPVPLDKEEQDQTDDEEDIDIKKVLKINENKDSNSESNNESQNSLEKSILEKISD